MESGRMLLTCIEFIQKSKKMNYQKYFYENNEIKLIIEEDVVGFYLIIYKQDAPHQSINDYLLDSLEQAFKVAKDKFGVSIEQ